jgi:hypothetical protein
LANLLEYGHIEQKNHNPKCNPEIVLDLGVIAHSKISEEVGVVQLSKDEDYSNPESATKMTIKIHRVSDDPFDQQTPKSDLAIQLDIKFQDYKSMVEFYYEVADMVDLHQSPQYRKDRTVDDFRFW